MSTQPAFAAVPLSPVVTFNTANTNRNGTGTIALLCTARMPGSRIQRVQFRATGTTTAGVIRVFKRDSGLTLDGSGAIGPPTSLDIAQAQSWPKGDLVFRQQRLDDLLAQMNRYSRQQVRLADPELGALAVSGVFHVGDQASLVAALERGWSLRAVRNGDDEIVLHGPGTPE